MKRAHALARTFEGDYMACLALAMTELYAAFERPVLVASYRFAVDDNNQPLVECLRYTHDGNTWRMKLVNQVSTVEGSRPSPRLDRRRARARKDHLQYLIREQERCWKQSQANTAFAKLATLREQELRNEVLALMADKQTRTHCEYSRKDERRSVCRSFADRMLGALIPEGLDQLPETA